MAQWSDIVAGAGLAPGDFSACVAALQGRNQDEEAMFGAEA